jgi:hypothetical protein
MPPNMVDSVSTRKMWEVLGLLSRGRVVVGYVLYSLHVCVCGCVRYDDCV